MYTKSHLYVHHPHDLLLPPYSIWLLLIYYFHIAHKLVDMFFGTAHRQMVDICFWYGSKHSIYLFFILLLTQLICMVLTQFISFSVGLDDLVSKIVDEDSSLFAFNGVDDSLYNDTASSSGLESFSFDRYHILIVFSIEIVYKVCEPNHVRISVRKIDNKEVQV